MLARLQAIPFQKIGFISMLVLWAALTFSTALVEIAFGVSVAIWFLTKLSRKKVFDERFDRSVMGVLLAYMVGCMLTYFWSENQGLSFRGSFKIIQHVAIFWMAYDLFAEKKSQSIFMNLFIGLAVVMMLNGFAQYFIGRDLIRGVVAEVSASGPRVSSAFKTYGQFASYLILILPTLAALTWIYRRSKTKLSVLCGVFTALGLVLLFLTRSRGAMLALGLSFVIFLVLKRKYWYLLLIAVAMNVFFYIFPPSTFLHLDYHGNEQSVTERYYLWDRALNVIREKPLTGMGINTYAVHHQMYDKTRDYRVRSYYAHNGYLQMTAEVGIPIAALFAIFVFLYFRRSFSLIHARPRGSDFESLQLGMLIGLMNFLLLAIVDTILHNPLPVMAFWYFSGLQLAFVKSVEREIA